MTIAELKADRAAPPPSSGGYRADIDGVRAIAVLAVVAFHLKAPFAQSGFTGVDVFFVLSGFLRTGNLASEGERNGAIDLARFWARRVRRLLPASTVTVLVTIIASLLFLPATAWPEVIRTAVAATLYYANFLFGADAADYFAANVEDNPLLHFWSLAVEEQFYLAWPVIIWAAIKWFRRPSRSIDSVLVVPIVILTVASFILSLRLTADVTPWSYYASPARAWEFGAGGLVALLARRSSCPPLLARVGPWIGLVLIAAGLLFITETTPFPGTAALLPVIGTSFLCFCVPPKGSAADRVLTMAPATGIGKVSYSFYLWHWPFLVIGQRALLNRSFEIRLLLVAASFVVAIASYILIENPTRRNRFLSRSNLPNYGLAAGLIIIGLVAAGIADRVADRTLDDPLLDQLAEAPEDYGWVRDAGCESNDAALLLENCAIGETGGATILLLGDSHAEHWEPALTEIVLSRGDRLVVRFRGGCPAPLVDATFRAIGQAECAALQAGTADLLDTLAPDLVVVSNSASYLAPGNIANGEVDQDQAWTDGVGELVTMFDSRAIPVLWIYDNPRMDEFPLDCVALNGVEDCNPTLEQATRLQSRARVIEEPIVTAYSRSLTFDPVPTICSDGRCEIVADGLVRYRDEGHLTASFVKTLTADLGPLVDDLIE